MLFFSNASVFYNATDGCGVNFVVYMEQNHPPSFQKSLFMAALDNHLPDNLPADQITSRVAAALRHAQETEATLYELFPFGLVYETLERVPALGGGPEQPQAVAPDRETGFRAALP
jgi:hypothetical protein